MRVTWPDVAQLLVFGVQALVWLGCALFLTRLRQHARRQPARRTAEPTLVHAVWTIAALAVVADLAAAVDLIGLTNGSVTVQLVLTLAQLTTAVVALRLGVRQALATHLMRLLRVMATLTGTAVVFTGFLASAWSVSPHEVDLTYAGGAHPADRWECESGARASILGATPCRMTYSWTLPSHPRTVRATFQLRREPGGPLGPRRDVLRIEQSTRCEADVDWTVTFGERRVHRQDGAARASIRIPDDGTDLLEVRVTRRDDRPCEFRFELTTPWQT
ncbi:MAG TPA: hypothetical protein VI076_11035 [Actinopolymorphaceae bacterium]